MLWTKDQKFGAFKKLSSVVEFGIEQRVLFGCASIAALQEDIDWILLKYRQYILNLNIEIM